MEEPLLTERKTDHNLLARLRLAYFTAGFSGTSVDRWILYYYLQKSLSPQTIGTIEAIKPVAQFAGSQALAVLADALNARKYVAIAAQALSAATLMLLLLPVVGCDQCALAIGITVCAAAFTCMPATSVLDTYTIEALGGARSSDYGRYRLGFALSWGFSGAVTGRLAESNASWPLYFYALCTLAQVVLLSLVLPPPPGAVGRGPTAPATAPASEAAPPRLSSALELLASPSRLYFLLEIFLFGAGMAIIEKCLFVYAIDELGASPLLCGLTVLSTTLPELPVFYLGDGLIRRLGRDACFVIALAAYALRVGAYCLLSAGFATPLLLIELLHGIIYALGWLVAVDYWREQVPAKWRLTGIMLLNVTKDCLGASTGAVFGGWFIEHGSFGGFKGGRALYLLASVAATSLCVAHGLASLVLRLCGRRGLLSS